MKLRIRPDNLADVAPRVTYFVDEYGGGWRVFRHDKRDAEPMVVTGPYKNEGSARRQMTESAALEARRTGYEIGLVFDD
jgi:hypothetical protein